MFFGQNIRHQVKFSSILSVEFLSMRYIKRWSIQRPPLQLTRVAQNLTSRADYESTSLFIVTPKLKVTIAAACDSILSYYQSNTGESGFVYKVHMNRRYNCYRTHPPLLCYHSDQRKSSMIFQKFLSSVKLAVTGTYCLGSIAFWLI